MPQRRRVLLLAGCHRRAAARLVHLPNRRPLSAAAAAAAAVGPVERARRLPERVEGVVDADVAPLHGIVPRSTALCMPPIRTPPIRMSLRVPLHMPFRVPLRMPLSMPLRPRACPVRQRFQSKYERRRKLSRACGCAVVGVCCRLRDTARRLGAAVAVGQSEGGAGRGSGREVRLRRGWVKTGCVARCEAVGQRQCPGCVEAGHRLGPSAAPQSRRKSRSAA